MVGVGSVEDSSTHTVVGCRTNYLQISLNPPPPPTCVCDGVCHVLWRGVSSAGPLVVRWCAYSERVTELCCRTPSQRNPWRLQDVITDVTNARCFCP